MQENTEPSRQLVDDTKLVPSTPQRGRGLYPSDLAKGGQGRVPLHKRGNSRTYERLEDLLREAGYKETRIFTPEAERQHDVDADKDKQSLGVAGMGTLLSFVSGLVNWNDSGQSDGGTQAVSKTQSLGRAALKNAHSRGRLNDDFWTPPTPTPKQQHPRKPFTPLSTTSNSSSNRPSTSSRPPMLHTKRTVRDARSTLRHMMSTPDFAQGVQSRKGPGGYDTQRQFSQQDAAPMPSNWLQTVTQAVLRTSPSSGAYVGGPAHNRGRTAQPRRNLQHTLQPNPYSTHRDGSTTSARNLLSVHACRATSTPSVVTTTSVLCRSAPGSRASSRVRDVKGRKEITRLPSLGATAVDADLWLPSFQSGLSSSPTPAPSTTSSSNSTRASATGLNDAGVSCFVVGVEDTAADDSDTDSDSGELDLARILVPPKRQQSIRSLRKHLHAAIAAEANGQGYSSMRVARRQRSIHNRDNRIHDNYSTGSGSSSLNNTRKPVGNPRSHLHATTLKIAPGLRSEFADAGDLFEPPSEQNRLRNRRGSAGESGESSNEWAAHGLPGLQKAAKAKKGSAPWSVWAQGRP